MKREGIEREKERRFPKEGGERGEEINPFPRKQNFLRNKLE